MPVAPTLRLTQTTLGPDSYQVEIAYEAPGVARRAYTSRVSFTLSAQDQEDVRWYLEDYLRYPFDPAPAIAARVGARMAELGMALFRAVFGGEDATRLWARLYDRLQDLRIEVVAGVQKATVLPWELLRDPTTDVPLALSADSFVRAQPNPARTAYVPKAGGPIRILLVIARPDRGDDVPFRSVASRLIKGLGDVPRDAVQLDVLRPPTFGDLERVLAGARTAGKPYHVVHFDGHGTYADTPDAPQTGDVMEWLRRMGPLMLAGMRGGAHGYLVFEHPDLKDNIELVDGTRLGQLLAGNDVPVLVLNACRSAHAEPPEQPAAVAVTPAAGAPAAGDAHAQVRAFGSLAQEVMDAGVAGVVAMRYNVYVVTAAQFVADLYAALAAGQTLGEAVARGRKQLHARPLRAIISTPRELQDWVVPVVYEAVPISLFRKRAQAKKLEITIQAGAASPARGQLDPTLPPPPDAGFYGRDETLLALDRAFDTQHLVLLHAFAGSGKTSAAAEFARWYSLTGGVAGPVLFTSFEGPKQTLADVLRDTFGRVFGDWLESVQKIAWSALTTTEQRRAVALAVLQAVPVLWIWDNVEPVAGFPTGSESEWSGAEQAALRDFLRDAAGTRAKFLLTSRRDERGWLGDLPARVAVPPMSMPERVQLAAALAARAGRRLDDVEDWRPLLRYTEGNPLTITVVVGQALRDGLRTRAQIDAYVARLRAGEAAFADDRAQGRARSLGASLSYGFEHAFAEAERAQLALLHFFQGFVDVAALRVMGAPTAAWCLPAVRGLTREAGSALLDRAAEVGLLAALGGGYYTIHPALPWYFKALFDAAYAADPLVPTRAFVGAMGELSNNYHDQYEDGNAHMIRLLGAEEANLLHALRLALAHDWLNRVMITMQGLWALYDHTGRRAAWAALVAEVVPAFLNPTTDDPLPGREPQWSQVTEYRVRLAEEARDWATAARLQRLRVDWNRALAAPALTLPPAALDRAGRNAIRSLAVSVSGLGDALREQGSPECIGLYEEDYTLSLLISDEPGAAITAYNLGRAYQEVSALRDLEAAERWYRCSLELRASDDRLGRSVTIDQIGAVLYDRFSEARESGVPSAELVKYAEGAIRAYQQSLECAPPNALRKLGLSHQHLANMLAAVGRFDSAFMHYRESIRHLEASNDFYMAGATRLGVAVALAQIGRFHDALLYARAALANFAIYGKRAAAEVQRTEELIARIERDQGGGGTAGG